MSDRPTPETDKNCGWALTSHYGRSEGKYLSTDKEGPFVHANFARKLERERDEAREALADALQEVDLRTLDFERMKQQRDEAREKLRKTRKFLEDANRGAETNAKIIQVQLDKILHLRRESEEARAFIEELVDLVAYGLGQNMSIWSQAAMQKAREAITKAKSLEGAK